MAVHFHVKRGPVQGHWERTVPVICHKTAEQMLHSPGGGGGGGGVDVHKY